MQGQNIGPFRGWPDWQKNQRLFRHPNARRAAPPEYDNRQRYATFPAFVHGDDWRSAAKLQAPVHPPNIDVTESIRGHPLTGNAASKKARHMWPKTVLSNRHDQNRPAAGPALAALQKTALQPMPSHAALPPHIPKRLRHSLARQHHIG